MVPGGALDHKRCARVGRRTRVRLVKALENFTRRSMLRGAEVSNCRHIAGNSAQSLEGVVDLFLGAGGSPRVDEYEQLFLVLPARLTGVEFGGIGQLWPPHQRTDTRPGLLAYATLQAGMDP